MFTWTMQNWNKNENLLSLLNCSRCITLVDCLMKVPKELAEGTRPIYSILPEYHVTLPTRYSLEIKYRHHTILVIARLPSTQQNK